MRCWRCGKKLKRDNVQILHLICGLSVPVCADDRQCYPRGLYPKKERKIKHDESNSKRP